MTTESWSHVVADPLPFAKLLGLELLTITPDRVAPVQRSPPRPAAFQPLRSLTRRPRRATPVGALSQARYLALAPSVVQTTDVLEQQLDLLAQAIAKGTSATQHMALHRQAETLTYLQRLQDAAATDSTVVQQWPDDQHARLGLALITAMRQATADAAAADQALTEALALAFAPTSTRPSPLTPQTALTWLQQALPGDPCVADVASVLMVSSGMMLQRGEIALALEVLTPLYALLAQPQQAYYLAEAYYARSLQAASSTDQLQECTRALHYAQEACNSSLHRQRASTLLQTIQAHHHSLTAVSQQERALADYRTSVCRLFTRSGVPFQVEMVQQAPDAPWLALYDMDPRAHMNRYVLQRISVHMRSSGICGVCYLETAVILSK